LEQVMANKEFREIAKHFSSICYIHLVPQLLRYSSAFPGPGVEEDPFGQHFMERVAKTRGKIRQKRLKKIEDALRIVVPQLKYLKDIKNEMGTPHLEVSCHHWQPHRGEPERRPILRRYAATGGAFMVPAGNRDTIITGRT
jgi:hypothetical protein